MSATPAIEPTIRVSTRNASLRISREKEKSAYGDTYISIGELSTGPDRVQARGRGRGRGRGQGRSRGSGSVQGNTGTQMCPMILEGNQGQATGASMTRRKRNSVAVNTSEGDTEPTSDSQISSCTSHRYSLRSREGTPLTSTNMESTEQSDVSEEEIAHSSASQKKGGRGSVARKRTSSRQPSKSSRGTKLVALPRLTSRLDHLPVRTSTTPTTQRNPLFLKMTHWMRANTIPNGTPNLAEPQVNQNTTLAAQEAPLETEVVNNSQSQSDVSSSENSQVNEGPKAIDISEKYALFRFIPSSIGVLPRGKRRRSRSPSQIGSLQKALCVYPGQSIRNQSSYLVETHSGERASAVQMASLLPLDQQSSVTPATIPPLECMGIDGSDSGAPKYPPSPSNKDNQSRMLVDVEATESDTTPRQIQRQLPSQVDTDSNMLSDMEERHPSIHAMESEDSMDSVTLAVANRDGEEFIVEGRMNDRTSVIAIVDSVERDQEVTRLEQDGLVGNVVPLMEFVHEELATDAIRGHVATIGRDVQRRWTQTCSLAPLNNMGAEYVLEGFQNIQVPVLLFSPVTPTSLNPLRRFVGHSSRAANIYLTIATYFHLLGLRAATSIRGSDWRMTKNPLSPCTLANFTLQLSNPQSTHNQNARDIFTSHFIRATHAKIYSARCITGALLTENKVSNAFNHALRVQVQLQRLSLTDTAYQAIHRQEHRDATKIGKWLLLNQALRATHNGETTQLITKIGPELCSSDESETEKNGDEEMESGQAGATVKMGETEMISWRSQGMEALFTLLQDQGLYPRHHSHLSPRKLLTSKPPPDGTPVSWISEQYLGRFNQR